MAINFGNWTTNPASLVNQPFKRPLQGSQTPGKWKYSYQRTPVGNWNIKRQWEGGWYADEPDAQEKGLSWLASKGGGQSYRMASMPRSWNPTASQFPWQVRTGISSDLARQRAYRMGIGRGVTPPRLVPRSPATYFDPRSGFNKSNIKLWV